MTRTIKNLEAFFELLFTKRNSGKVICQFQSINNDDSEPSKEEFLSGLGCNTDEIKNEWRLVDRRTAKRILQYILSMDMAYDGELDSSSLAEELSEYFLNEFSIHARYYTNGFFREHEGAFKLAAWVPITDSVFDTGVFAVDKSKMGILWAEDND